MGAVCVGIMVAMAVAISVVEGAMPTMAVTMSTSVGGGGIAQATALAMVASSGQAGIP